MNISSREAPILVGIDGSASASDALEWAVEEARLRNQKLRIVHVFSALVSMVGTEAGTTVQEHFAVAENDARRTFDAALEKAPSLEGLDVERVLIPGSPAEQLVGASQDASLLVVGSRGLGNIRGMLLGSVSMRCVQQAHCSVVVVRTGD